MSQKTFSEITRFLNIRRLKDACRLEKKNRRLFTRVDKRFSIDYISIIQSTQLLTFRIFLFKSVELYQIIINFSYCNGVLKLWLSATNYINKANQLNTRW